MTTGDRLKQERERLGFTQPVFAAIGATTKKSQIDYEKNVTQPKSGYLAAIAAIGADVLYILTGQRSPSALSADELEMLERFRAASLEGKAAAMGALRGLASPAKIHVVTNHGQVAHKIHNASAPKG